MPEFLKYTINQNEALRELFLLHDSGVDDDERILIFATQKNIKLLDNSHLFADGTFDVAPDVMMVIISYEYN